MKVFLKLIPRLTNCFQKPGLRISTAVHTNPKERDISLTLRGDRVGTHDRNKYSSFIP